jgi:acetyltransferase-like isoleucine patch superfamily enzyme
LTERDGPGADPAALLEVRLRRCVDRPASLSTSVGTALVEVVDALPTWWREGGCRLFTLPGATLPGLSLHPGLPAPTNAVVILAGDVPPQQIMLWGADCTVMLGSGTTFPASGFHCGDGAVIAIGAYTVCTWAASVDARNGGTVLVGAHGLWASNVQLNSDDMHAIRDRDGRRINAFGGNIVVEDHVWLAYQSLVLSGARIGAGSVVGARAVVKGRIPPQSICAGVPARVVRSDIQWSAEDQP